MKRRIFLLLVAMLLENIVASGFAAEPTETNLPKVVLIGDSIRMGYAPFVADLLKGKATVINDLHALVVKEGAEKMLGSDGTHYDDANSRKLAMQVTDAVTKRLPQ